MFIHIHIYEFFLIDFVNEIANNIDIVCLLISFLLPSISLATFLQSHHPSSVLSRRAVDLLRSALINPYPPGNDQGKGPLEFDLEITESAPNKDQVKTILSYLPSPSASLSSTFLSAHPSSINISEGVSSQTLSEIARSNPGALKWPIVVDWNNGRASIGNMDGVKKILDEIREAQK